MAGVRAPQPRECTSHEKPVLIMIEDESDIQEIVAFNFQKAGYAVHGAQNGLNGLPLVKRLAPDLVILDLMLPDIDGREVCRQLRVTRFIPIMMLTALAGESDRIVGFKLGADDYLNKPFSPRELVLRAQATLHRTKEPPLDNKAVNVSRLTIDPERHHVEFDGRGIQLTSTEFRLLHYLANTSYELRIPLAAIKGAAETLLDGALDSPSHARNFVEMILRHSGRMEPPGRGSAKPVQSREPRGQA